MPAPSSERPDEEGRLPISDESEPRLQFVGTPPADFLKLEVSTCVVCRLSRVSSALSCSAKQPANFANFPGGTFTPSDHRAVRKRRYHVSDDMSSVKVLHSHVFPTDARGAVRGSGARYPCRVSGCPISMQTTWCS